jgi:DNA-binding NarL/FixJ family response regulator
MQPVRVFIVDDSAQLAEMLGELLADPGRVDIAGSADSVASAVPAIAAARPDVAIIDLQLADGNGFEVAEAIRHLPGGDAIEIVFLSNHVAPEFARRAAELGSRHFLDKSKDHATIVELVQQKVAQRNAVS